MAGTTIAYSEITILDLIDTATYIYYSANENGTGATIAPDADTRYIGIYSGPALENGQPAEPPADTIWSKYVGESVTIESTSIQYAISDDGQNAPTDENVWSNTIPTVNNGQYLWTRTIVKYNDGKSTTSYSVSRFGKDGEAGDSYYIEANYDEVLRFSNNGEAPSYSPGLLSFQVYDLPRTNNSIPKDSFNYDLTLILSGPFYTEAENLQSGKLYYIYDPTKKEKYIPYEYNEDTQIDIPLFERTEGKSFSLKDELVNTEGVNEYVFAENDDSAKGEAENGVTVVDESTDGSISNNPQTVYFLIENYSLFLTQNRVEGDSLRELFLTGRPLFKFSLLNENEDEIAVKIFECRPGTTDEMAKFSVTAASINAAVRDSLMTFTANGLTLQNGAFTIIGNDGQKLLYAEDGNLKIKGYIEASGGSFTGELISPRGNIGGFLIDKDRLYSKSEKLILYGAEGKIYAENIELGKYAQVEDYIAFPYEYFITSDTERNLKKTYYIFNADKSTYSLFVGDFVEGQTYYEAKSSYIYNPHKNNNNIFIEANGINIKANGQASFGEIYIDGPNSEIYGTNFSITPDQAIFKNVVVSGAIETSVFKTGSTQAAGGAMLFLPSYKIQGQIENIIEGTQAIVKITLEEEPKDINVNTIIWVVKDQFYTSLIVSGIEGKVLIANRSTGANIEGTSIIVIGPSDTPAKFIMGINSGNGNVANGLIKGRGLTINKYGNTENDLPSLFLGDLSSIGYEGYGLYSDNVYLNGSLTTKIDNNSYAGINTLNGYTASIFQDSASEDSSPIVFWAGAQNETQSGIQNAPFQVTSAGSVYAKQAVLEGSLLAKSKIIASTIEGSEIYAAKIYGGKETESAPLEIYDTDKGISFKSKTNNIETLAIGQTGLQSNEKSFISIEGNKVQFIGNSIRTSEQDGEYLELTGLVDSQGDFIPVMQHIYSANKKCGFYFRPDSTDFEIVVEETSKKKMQLSYQQVQLNDEIIFSSQTAMQFTPCEGGYDLFIV